MSFGFGIGDFIAVLDRANSIRVKFVSAPAQFKALADELRNFTIVVNDVKIDLSETSLGIEQQHQLQEISIGCSDVLTGIEETINRYSAISAPHSFKKTWKRLTWEPDDVRDLRNRLCSNISLLNAINGRITRNGIFELLDYKNREKEQDCLDWLAPAHSAIQQSELISRRHPGTGKWLLDSFKYQAWMKRTRETLFCPGIPGSGKSILSSIVIDDLEAQFEHDRSVGIAYIFCSFENRDDQIQRPESLLASVLRQLAQRLVNFPSSVLKLYDKHRPIGTRPSFGEVFLALESVLSEFDRVFIIIDALDECENIAISKVLNKFFHLQIIKRLNIFATSRFLPEIMATFDSKGSLIQEVRASKEDVTDYVLSELKSFPAIVSRNSDLQQEVANRVAETNNGMFLLAKLALDSLRTRRTARSIRKELEDLARGSQTYDRAYDKTMERIQSQKSDGDMAMNILSWVACTKRLLSVSELLHALATELAESEFHEDNIPDLDDIVSACAGLITEYFERKWTRWFPDAHDGIAATCLTYLSFDALQDGPCFSDKDLMMRVDNYPLYSYAAKNWGHHASAQEVDEELLVAFLKDTSKVLASTQELFSPNGFSTYGDMSQIVPLGFTGTHLAAYFGLEAAVHLMIQHHPQPSLTDSANRNPLAWAAYAGHWQVVKIFLENGVDPSIHDWEGRTPISLAASMGHFQTVNLLLDHSVDPNSVDRDNQTPISWAAYRGFLDVVQLLVKKGANPDHTDEYGRTPLSWAATGGWPEVVQFLLDQHVDKDSKDKIGRTPLSWAAECGHIDVFRCLLKDDAQLSSKDAEDQTPASLAAKQGHEDICQLIRDFELDLQFKRSNYGLDSFFIMPDSVKVIHLPNRASEKQLRCPFCTFRGSRPLLKLHLAQLHYTQFTYHCDESFCRSVVGRNDKLKTHYQSRHNIWLKRKDLKRYKKENPCPKQCSICQRKLKSWDECYECALSHSEDLSSGWENVGTLQNMAIGTV